MKFTSALGLTMSGSQAGVTASHNKGGQYFRRRSIPTDPGSGSQVAIRGVFGSLSQIWTDTLTQMQRDSWDNYAQNVSWVDSLGQTIQLSGINHFVRANSPREYADMTLGTSLGRIDQAPAVNELGVSPTGLVGIIANAVGPPNVITVAVQWSNDASFGANDRLLIYLSAGQNQGISFFKGPYIISGSDAANSSPVNITLFDDTPTPTPYSNRFGAPQEGQRLFGYGQVAMEDGRLSSRVRFQTNLVPAAS